MDQTVRYKTSEVKAIFSVESYSVTRWADDFKEYLDKDACPSQKNAPRYFTHLDVKKLALIKKMRLERRPTTEISAALANGQTEEPPDDVNALAFIGSANTPALLKDRVKKLTLMLLEKDKELATVRGNLDEVRREKEDLQRKLLEAYKTIGRLEDK